MCPQFHVQKKNGTYYSIMIPYAKQTVNLEPPTWKAVTIRTAM